MDTEEIIKLLNQNNIDYLKLGEVVFHKSTKTLSLVFLCSEENYELSVKNIKLIEEIVKNYVKLNINYEIKIKKAYLDEEILEKLVKNYFNKNNKLLALTLLKINITKTENTFNICATFNANLDEINLGEISLKAYLKKYYFYEFNFDFSSQIVEVDNIDKHKEEILNDIVTPTKVEKMQVKNLVQIIGEDDYKNCYPIEYFKNEEEGISTCGKIVEISEHEFNKKNRKGEDEVKFRFSLVIESVGTKFNATIFSTKSNLEKIRSLKVGDEICVTGDYQIYSSSFCLKVRRLAKCEILPYTLVEAPKNKEFANYIYVQPTKYDEQTQINLFEQKTEVKDYLKNNEFVVFDLETTGLDYLTCKVTEIGAVKIKNGKISEIFSTFVNPQVPISKEITKLTSITDEMVKDAPMLEDVLPDFFKFCKNTTLVAQNTAFDFSFIDYNSRKINYIFENEKEDTLVIAKKYVKGLKNYKLKTIAEYLNVPLINAHRAINDAMCTAKVFISLVENYY